MYICIRTYVCMYVFNAATKVHGLYVCMKIIMYICIRMCVCMHTCMYLCSAAMN